MGTRGLIGFVSHNGKRHAIYNHHDSYPTALGRWIVEFILLLGEEQLGLMIKNVEKIIWVDCEDDSTANKELLRRCHDAKGVGLLDDVLEGKVRYVADDVEFLEDDIFCEWAYFIDIENRKLEIYKSSKLLKNVSFEMLAEVGNDREEGFMVDLERRYYNGEFEEVLMREI